MAFLRNWNHMPSTRAIEDVVEQKAVKGAVEAAKAFSYAGVDNVP